MKSFFMSLITFIAATSAHASSFTCSQDRFVDASAMVDSVSLHCSNGQTVTMYGYGIGLRGAMSSGFAIMCTATDARGSYYGAKVDAAVFVGAGLSAFAGMSGICVIPSGSLGSMGFNGSISHLTIE